VNRPRLLDLFCGAGGAAMGYHRAGFEVVGVDIKPQPHYPFEFHQADALTYPLDGFDAYHASPPCQAYSVTRNRSKDYPDLVGVTRQVLACTCKPYVIENVMGAPLRNPIKLCGSSFLLNVWRHRLFESNILLLRPQCRHKECPPPLQITGKLHPTPQHRKPWTLEEGSAAMGIDWMSWEELTQAIPPAYTEYIGGYLIKEIERA
jgi:DNA (cytosine-5)-methyltransferase 1